MLCFWPRSKFPLLCWRRLPTTTAPSVTNQTRSSCSAAGRRRTPESVWKKGEKSTIAHSTFSGICCSWAMKVIVKWALLLLLFIYFFSLNVLTCGHKGHSAVISKTEHYACGQCVIEDVVALWSQLETWEFCGLTWIAGQKILWSWFVPPRWTCGQKMFWTPRSHKLLVCSCSFRGLHFILKGDFLLLMSGFLFCNLPH